MSLPDTVFIFVLALIIFGPKKLPEIGRQMGRLVGEFRRASNEFKFQIEEELRQADTPKSPNTIATPKTLGSAEDADLSLAAGEVTNDSQHDFSLSESVAAGQHPNFEAMQEVVDSSSVREPEKQRTDNGVFTESKMPVSLATITASLGTQARLSVPYAPVAEEPASLTEDSTAAAKQESHLQNNAAGDAPSASPPAGHPAPSQAEIHHG